MEAVDNLEGDILGFGGAGAQVGRFIQKDMGRKLRKDFSFKLGDISVCVIIESECGDEDVNDIRYRDYI